MSSSQQHAGKEMSDKSGKTPRKKSYLIRGLRHFRRQTKPPGADIEERQPKEWRPSSLSWGLNIPMFVIEIGFIAAVIALDRVSATKNGVIDVPEHTRAGELGKLVHNYYSLLWTSLPNFLFNLYGMAWAAVVTASATRQPYVELRRGAGALKTIMLDYGAIPAYKNWSVAFRNGHAHIAVGLLLALLVSNVLSSLTAHLLVAQSAQFSTMIPVTLTTEFNPSLLTSTTNLQPFIDVATAIQVYNTSPPAWTTDTYAFERFAISNGQGVLGNVTAPVSAYSALLQCETIDASAYGYTLGELVGGTEPLSVKFVDRGCEVSQQLSISPTTPIYATAWYAMCDNSRTNRFGMFAGQYSASSPTNLKDFSVTSCIPTYWQTNGSLTMAYANSDNSSKSIEATYLSFTGTAQAQIDPELQILFENGLRDYTIFNPSSATFADAVGFTIYTAAQQKSAQSSPGASTVLESTQAIYATVFAAMASTVLMQPPTQARTESGTLSTQRDRLFVSSTIAYIFVAAMAVVLACHIVLFVYSRTHQTFIDEEPVGLLGAAKLLRQSELFEIVDEFEERHTRDGEIGRMQKYMRKHFRLGHGDHCWWDEQERRIKVQGLTED
ncbi:hypothetical protein H2200_007573 [Cladophialophora chaetospira]|uniref:Uncharacterized protein n=1 Tax=Cladophialophora chaetospira TaxID=386627 RepID=A0AA39CGQ8_9EURO|nr:hypothetical protein H2200_007573 [Cladophialophora chaetospira]